MADRTGKRQSAVGNRLRPARASDYHAVRHLLSDAKLPIEGLEDFFGEGYVVCELEGRVIGALGVEIYGRYGLLRSAVVDETYRGEGLGEQLTKERLEWARSQGLEAVYLLTTTAAPFFERLGFERVERPSAPAEVQASKEFSSVCPSSAVCMRLVL